MIFDKNEQCRRCLLRESGGENEYLEIRRCLERMKPEEKAADGLYKSRLDICEECEHLISGTCMKCGCYVELRAAYKKNKCPLAGKGAKW